MEEGSNYFKRSQENPFQLDVRFENAFLLIGLCREQGIDAARELATAMGGAMK